MPVRNDTVLRLSCDGPDASTTFTDTSLSGLTVTAVGDAQVDTAQSKWGGASLLLDGSGDRLSIASSAVFGFGTGAWTAEAWIRPTALTTDRFIFDFRPGTSAAHGCMYLNASGRLTYYNGTTVRGGTGTAVTVNTWAHVAWCFDGSWMRAFLNGVQQWAQEFTPDFSTARPLVIGANWAGTAAFVGHIDDIRVVDGAWYTADFTPPVAPLDTLVVEAQAQVASPLASPRAYGIASPQVFADPFYDDVVLLLHFDGANGATSFTDSSGLAWSVLCSSGATLSTTDPLFGTASLNIAGAFDGEAWIDISANGGADFRFGTGDFTVEGRSKTTVADRSLIYWTATADASWVWYVVINASGFLEWWRFPLAGNSERIVGATTSPVNTGTWKSWAASRINGVLKLFVDGVEVASAADTTNYVAVNDTLSLAPACQGKHDEFRITKGVGRYAADYVLHTEAFREGPPLPAAIIAVASPLGIPRPVALAQNFVFPSALSPATAFGTATAQAFYSATGAEFSAAFGLATYEPDSVVGAASTGPSTLIGLAQAVRGIPLLPAGAARSAAPTTTFGVPAAASSAQCTAGGATTTNMPTPTALVRQSASGFATGVFGSATSVPGARATGVGGTVFGTPGLASARGAAGSLFGAFGLPSSRSPVACGATGWAGSQFGLPDTTAVRGRTRSAVFRTAFGRAQAERTAA